MDDGLWSALVGAALSIGWHLGRWWERRRQPFPFAWMWISGRSKREQRKTWRAPLPFWVGLLHWSSSGRQVVNGLYLRVGDRWCAFGLRPVQQWERERVKR